MNYCWRCGKALIQVRHEPDYYDEGTGVPYYKYVRACPDKRWWNRHVRVHASFRSDDRADSALDWEWHHHD